MPMSERPQPKPFNWQLMISVVTLALAIMYGFWAMSDRQDAALKRQKEEGIELGVQKNKNEATQDLLLKQEKDITELKRTLGLLPPDKTKEKK